MDEGASALTAGFQRADEAIWRALVEKTLNGASFEKRLVSRTYDGIEIQPLYHAGNGATPLADALRSRAVYDPDRPWDIRAVVDHPDPEEANALLLAELEGGAASLLVKIDPSGQNGVAVACKADLERALDGVLFDLAPIALDAGFLGPQAARWLSEIAQSKTLKPHLHLHLDPIGAFARAGRSQGEIEAHIRTAAQTAAEIDAEQHFLASGHLIHEAGGAEAQEIAVAAAIGLAYAKAAATTEFNSNHPFKGIVLGLAADAEYFTTIAKIRAAKAVWANLAKTFSTPSHRVSIEVRSSRRMLSTLDPWVNMLRLASAAFGASVGGADAIVLDCFTQPLGRPTPFARRQARNTQLILMEEAHLGRVADPAGGAWFIETLTDRMARAAWSFFQEIEKQGGVVAALSSGFITDHVGEACAARSVDVAKRKTGLVGVSEFADLVGAMVEIDDVDETRFAKAFSPPQTPDPDTACPPLKPRRASEGFEQLRARAKIMNPPPSAFLATIGGPKDYTARVGFARNFLAAGGVTARVGMEADYDEVGEPLIVLCGSDADYAQSGEAMTRRLKIQGAKLLYLAGRPDDRGPILQAAGVDGFIFTGANLEVALADILGGLSGGARA